METHGQEPGEAFWKCPLPNFPVTHPLTMANLRSTVVKAAETAPPKKTLEFASQKLIKYILEAWDSGKWLKHQG